MELCSHPTSKLETLLCLHQMKLKSGAGEGFLIKLSIHFRAYGKALQLRKTLHC